MFTVDCVACGVQTFILAIVYSILFITLVTTVLLMCASFFHNLVHALRVVVMPFARALYAHIAYNDTI
jgi:hypothetical protein